MLGALLCSLGVLHGDSRGAPVESGGVLREPLVSSLEFLGVAKAVLGREIGSF